jgi:hypothetical protein
MTASLAVLPDHSFDTPPASMRIHPRILRRRQIAELQTGKSQVLGRLDDLICVFDHAASVTDRFVVHAATMRRLRDDVARTDTHDPDISRLLTRLRDELTEVFGSAISLSAEKRALGLSGGSGQAI